MTLGGGEFSSPGKRQVWMKVPVRLAGGSQREVNAVFACVWSAPWGHPRSQRDGSMAGEGCMGICRTQSMVGAPEGIPEVGAAGWSSPCVQESRKETRTVLSGTGPGFPRPPSMGWW